MNNPSDKTTAVLIASRNRTQETAILNKMTELFPGKYRSPLPDETEIRQTGEKEKGIGLIAAGCFTTENRTSAGGTDGNSAIIAKETIDQIRTAHPNLITVLIRENGCAQTSGQSTTDTTADPNLFDITVNCDRSKESDKPAREIDYHLDAILKTAEIFPLPSRIDELNKTGYDGIAAEFTEEKRITTCNFHTSSTEFMKKAIGGYVEKGDRVLEIGPGQNWLLKSFEFPEMDYYSVDVSMNMLDCNRSKEGKNIVGSVRSTPFEDEFFDVVIASLGDPYFYPTALVEIYRILKKGGKFILTAPSSSWSDSIRSTSTDRTRFARSDGSFSEVYSFTFLLPEMEKLLSMLRFRVLIGEELCFRSAPECVISPALTCAAEEQNVTLDRLVVLNAVVCAK